MYFYNNAYYGDISHSLRTSFGNFWNSYYEFGNYLYVNNPDGTLSVYYSPSKFSGSTSDIQNFTSQITETSCNSMKAKFNELRDDVTNAMKEGISQFPINPPSSNIYTPEIYPANSNTYTNTNLLNPSFPSVYWDSVTNKCMSREGRLDYSIESDDCCNGDESVDYSELMTQPLSAITTIEDFEYYLSSELIDAKSRKVLSGYPTIRALYDRYINSNEYCATTSSAFDYTKMDQFAHLIDSYWVDIVEQVIPATTIWGSVKVYGNTIFDQQKFQYKKGTLFTCISGPCSLDDIEFLNNCVGSIIGEFYSDECPSLATAVSTYYFGDE